VGKVTIFSRTVITDHATSGKYWDKGTAIQLDKATGKFTASFKTFRHTRRIPNSTSWSMAAVSAPTRSNPTDSGYPRAFAT
jgi:hypothetical protein